MNTEEVEVYDPIEEPRWVDIPVNSTSCALLFIVLGNSVYLILAIDWCRSTMSLVEMHADRQSDLALFRSA